MDRRFQLMENWLSIAVKEPITSIAPASADASFRRYFRIATSQGTQIVMDAPPDKEPLDSFIEVSSILAGLGVHAPSIRAINKKDGFLLLEDFGNRTFLNELQDTPQQLYTSALGALIKIQSQTAPQSILSIPHYDANRLKDELTVFEDWFVGQHLGVTFNREQQSVWQETQSFLIEVFLDQPQVLVHRDFHSRNLMVVEDNSPGVIDFQDMVLGPISYDLASLFKDCYIEWPRSRQKKWLMEYISLAETAGEPLQFDLAQLLRWYDLTGLQRHLRVLGVFCRLNLRDGKNQYLDDLPLVKKYVRETLSLYPELASFRDLFSEIESAKT